MSGRMSSIQSKSAALHKALASEVSGVNGNNASEGRNHAIISQQYADSTSQETAIKSGGHTDPSFIHLRVHSAYSLLEGSLQVKALIAQASKLKAPAIALTDTNNLFGALQFTDAAKGAGIQPIIGCELDLYDPGYDVSLTHGGAATMGSRAPLVFIAATQKGYDNLVEIVSRSYLDNADGSSVGCTLAMLRNFSEGVICLTGGPFGPIGRMIAGNDLGNAERMLRDLQNIFGDRLYVELQRHGDYSKHVEYHSIDLAYQLNLPLVATNEVYFAGRDDAEAHDALIAIAEGTVIAVDERRQVNPDHYLKSEQEMTQLFADIPEALENTVEIAHRCSGIPLKRAPILPRFTTGVDPNASQDELLAAEAAELKRQAEEGLQWRIDDYGLADGFEIAAYEKRLAYELGIIENMGFPGYFLIVADFIKWAKEHDIPVGPGRGSGAGSLVAYALSITDVDPLQFSLLFERFLNPDRVSMPDFDIDFCQDRREEVIAYVQERYGRDQVAQIITFGTLQARAVLRDVGRVLQMPYGQVDRLCKMVPSNPANPVSLGQAIKDEPRFAEEAAREPNVEKLLEMAQKLEGLYRHASTHAAGIVIGDRPLSQLVPMYRDPRSEMPVTQYNMKWVEQAGLVKFDFLGLKTLTVLQRGVELIRRKGIDIDLAHIPLDDALTFEKLSRGETVGVFQVESAGMRKALLGMRPDRIEDIIALVALYRPGPMENIPTYNACKHKEQEVASIHPMIDHLVAETQGVIVYQEQVMQIAQELAGYSLGEADLLRRAMGKKIRSEMEVQRERFVSGALENQLTKPQANTIFDLLAKFADYGFNKSHAAAYAIVSYQTAYLKAHHPVEFIAASMTYDMGNTDKLNDYRQDAKRLKIEIVPPSVQTSHAKFEVSDGKIFYALAAIKGVGEGAAEHIIAVRGDKPFDGIEDFCERVDPRMVNKRVYENLINAGAFDCFNPNRAQMVASMERLIGLSARAHDNASSGQGDIFGAMFAGDTVERERIVFADCEPWETSELLQREYDAIGFYLSAHPLDQHQAALDQMNIKNFADYEQDVKAGRTDAKLAGSIISRQERRTKTGNKMGIVVLSDATSQYEVVMFSEVWNQYRDMMDPGRCVILGVSGEDRPEGINMRVQLVQDLDLKARDLCSGVTIFMRDARPVMALKSHLQTKGNHQISLVVIRDNGKREIDIMLGDQFEISPKIASAMRAIDGVMDVKIH